MTEASTHQFFQAFKARKLGIISDPFTERSILVAPAHNITPELVNEMLHLSGGILFAALSNRRASAFILSPMSRPRVNPAVVEEGAPQFLTSVEARQGVGTGISAHDRAVTLGILGAPEPEPRKLVSPGHIFPVQVRSGGVLEKNALPEAAVDLIKACGETDAAVYIDLLEDNGEFLSTHHQELLSKERNIPILTLDALTRFRLETESLVHRVAETKIPTHQAGELRSILYKSDIHEGEHLALVKGNIGADEVVLTRVQPEFTFGDVFGGNNPPSRKQLHTALRIIGQRGKGVLVYLRRPLLGELKAQISSWQTKYSEKPAAMMREYGLGAQILRDLGIKRIEVMTGSNRNLVGLTTFGVEIVSQCPFPK